MYYTNMGTKLQLGSEGDTPTFTDIPRLSNIPGLAMESGKIEVTHNQSTSREYIPDCLPDPGDYSFDMETDRTNIVHQTLFSLRGTTNERKFRLIYPDGQAWEFTGCVMSITRAAYDPKNPNVLVDTVALAISDVTDISDQLLS